MARDLFWKIEELLSSSTSDLRELAKIADEDPATLYIGTSMDNADIRGQDLRGMCFTHLDLRKVTRDSNTRWDNIIDESRNLVPCPYDKFRSVESATAIILLKNLRDQDVSAVMSLRKLDGAVIFNKDEELYFREAARSFKNAKIVIVEYGKKLNSIELMKNEFDSKTIILAAYGGGYRFLDKHDYRFADSLKNPLIIVPMPSLSQFGVMPTLSGPLIDLAAIIINNFDRLYSQANKYNLSIFFRAKGIGRDTQSDAWCQILSNITRSGLGGCGGLILMGSEEESDDRLPYHLFTSLDKYYFNVPSSLSRSFDGGTLIDPINRIANAEKSYKAAILILLEKNGWRLAESEFPPSNSDGIWVISNGKKFFSVEINNEPGSRDVWELPKAVFQEGLDIDEIGSIIVSEEVSDRQIVDRLINYGRLWVTARDICNFDAKHGSIWSILSQQMRRIGRSVHRPIRSIYLAIILRIALDRNGLETENGILLERIFSDPDFDGKYILSQIYKSSPKNGIIHRTTIDIKQKYIDNELKSIIEVDLEIGYDGPIITRLENLI